MHKLKLFGFLLLLSMPLLFGTAQALAAEQDGLASRHLPSRRPPATTQATPTPQIIGGIRVDSGPPAGAKVNPVTIINTTINWAFGLLLILAGAFIVYAAFEFLTSAGDPEKVKHAKNLILYAVIAIAVAFLAQAIVGIVRALLRAGFTG